MSVSSARPLLRGYLHAGAAVAAALGGTYLLVLSSGDPPRQLSMLVYGAGLTALFHLLTIAAAAAFYVLVVVYVLPAPRP